MMTPRRAFARGCLFLLGCGLVFLSPVEAAAVYTKPEFDEKNCEEVLGCHVCSPEEKAQVRECASSGKVITLNCPLDGDNNEDTVTRYMPCNRTQDDERSRFVHFQLFCLIVGTISYVWVRRFRVTYASLFEQRKLSIFPRRGDVESANGGATGSVIEMASREEVSPLSNSNLEVI